MGNGLLRGQCRSGAGCNRGSDVNIALRIGNFDAVLLKLVIHPKVDVAYQVSFRVNPHLIPHAQLEIEGAITERHEPHHRLRLFQHIRHFGRYLEQYLLNVSRIGTVGDSDRDTEADFGISVTPVDDTGGNEFGIRHDDRDVVIGDNGGAARLDLDDIAFQTAHIDAVTDLDGTLDENDDATDEIADDILQTNPQPQPERARQKCQAAKVDAHDLERDRQPDENHDVTGETGDDFLQPDAHSGSAQHARQQQFSRRCRHDKYNRNQDDKLEQGQERERDAAYLEFIGQHLDDGVNPGHCNAGRGAWERGASES